MLLLAGGDIGIDLVPRLVSSFQMLQVLLRTVSAVSLSMANYRIGRKRRGVTWSNNVTEGNGRLVFKRDLEFAMDRFKIWFWYKVTIPSPKTSGNNQDILKNWALITNTFD